MADTPKQWNDKISLEITYGEAVLLLGEMSIGIGTMNLQSLNLKSKYMMEFGQQLIEAILVNGEEDLVGQFKDHWSKLYYNSLSDKPLDS